MGGHIVADGGITCPGDAAKGVRYFTCPPETGGFLRPDKVEMS